MNRLRTNFMFMFHTIHGLSNEECGRSIRYIITHTDAYRDFIEGELGLEVHYEDEMVRVYSIEALESASTKD